MNERNASSVVQLTGAIHDKFIILIKYFKESATVKTKSALIVHESK